MAINRAQTLIDRLLGRMRIFKHWCPQCRSGFNRTPADRRGDFTLCSEKCVQRWDLQHPLPMPPTEELRKQLSARLKKSRPASS